MNNKKIESNTLTEREIPNRSKSKVVLLDLMISEVSSNVVSKTFVMDHININGKSISLEPQQNSI